MRDDHASQCILQTRNERRPGVIEPVEQTMRVHALGTRCGRGDAPNERTVDARDDRSIDRVVPSSKDSEETFHVLAGRLQFKSDWTSRDAIQLIYARWFYGSRTRNEGTGERTPDRLDDELFALNFNMWW